MVLTPLLPPSPSRVAQVDSTQVVNQGHPSGAVEECSLLVDRRFAAVAATAGTLWSFQSARRFLGRKPAQRRVQAAKCRPREAVEGQGVKGWPRGCTNGTGGQRQPVLQHDTSLQEARWPRYVVSEVDDISSHATTAAGCLQACGISSAQGSRYGPLDVIESRSISASSFPNLDC